jgi:hypothetical protein
MLYMNQRRFDMTLAASVWNTLSRIDVAPFVEHIQIGSGKNLSYVPWHRAWLLVKRVFPAATYCHGEDIHHPDARDINDNRQRCLVKALAFAGLGLSLWDAGSTIPVGTLGDPISSGQRGVLMKLISASEADLDAFLRWAGVEEVSDLPNEKFEAAKALLTAKLNRK